MRRYFVLLLITGIVWAQTDFYDYDLPYDEYFGELVLKDGTTYLGEYSKTEEKIVYFKHQDALAFQPVPVKLIQTLKLKDGTVLLHNGIIKKNKHTLGLGEYQKFSTKEKAIYDAKSKNLGKWYLFGPMSTILLGGCVVLNMGLNGFSTPSPIFLGGSLAASLTIPYFVLNRKEKINFPKSILTDSEKEIYKQAYSKRLKGRKINYIVGSTIVTGGIIVFMFMNAMSELDFGSSSGSGSNIFTPW